MIDEPIPRCLLRVVQNSGTWHAKKVQQQRRAQARAIFTSCAVDHGWHAIGLGKCGKEPTEDRSAFGKDSTVEVPEGLFAGSGITTLGPRITRLSGAFRPSSNQR